jgi:hypothetical protein
MSPGDSAVVTDDGSSYWPQAAWRTAKPSDVGMDASRLNTLVNRIRSKQIAELNGLVVVRHDLEIQREAFTIAGFNQRLAAIDALLDRRFPIDYAEWGSTLLQWAEGNRITVLAEHLLKHGARPTSG